ncbi:MAG: trypsin-like serine protease [Pseudomonadota bacterium]
MRFFLSTFLILAASVVQADRFAAAGRLVHKERGSLCSAVLIEPRIVVTAAHCVPKEGADRVSFELPTDEAREFIAIEEFVIHPFYAEFREQRYRRLRFDIALGQLSEPIDPSDVRPATLGEEAQIGEALFIASWPRGSGPRPRQRRCYVIEGVVPAVVTLGCRVRGGESGAPLFRLVEDGVEMVAIINSRAAQGDQDVALAADVRLRIRPLLDALRNSP